MAETTISETVTTKVESRRGGRVVQQQQQTTRHTTVESLWQVRVNVLNLRDLVAELDRLGIPSEAPVDFVKQKDGTVAQLVVKHEEVIPGDR